MTREKSLDYEIGSDNVFADLGLGDGSRAQLGHTVRLI